MGNNLVYKYAITFFVTPPDAAVVVAVAQFRAITHFLPSSLLWLLLLSITFSVASSVIVAVPLSEVRPDGHSSVIVALSIYLGTE